MIRSAEAREREKKAMSLPPILQKLRVPVIGAPMFIASQPLAAR